jgi:hypothetical protein
VRAEIAAWEGKRNAERRTITWTFTTTAARTKLDHLYPLVPDDAHDTLEQAA